MVEKNKKYERHEKKHNKHAHKEISKKHLGRVQGGKKDNHEHGDGQHHGH
jgi:hypothetical protein